MKFTRTAFNSLATAALLLTTHALVSAQDGPREVVNEQAQAPREAAARPTTRFIAEAGIIAQGKADIDGGGNLSVTRFDAGLLYQTDVAQNLRFGGSYLFGVNDYDFGSAGFGAPWDTVIFNRLGVQLSRTLDDRWSVRGGGVLMSSRETGADLGDSITGGFSVGADYRHSQTLFLSGGFACVSQLEDDVQVIPMLGVNWKASDRWLFRLGSVPFSGGAAAGLEAEYKLSDRLELAGGMLYHQRRFRLDDSGPAPGGVGQERTFPLRLRLGWKVSEKVSLHLLGGIVTGGELLLEDSGGNRLAKPDYDPAPYISVRALFRF